MGLIGSITGVAGTLIGGRMAADAMNRYGQVFKNELKDNQQWYDRRYNEDTTQRADAQRILSQTEEAIRQRNKSAAGKAAVMGTTDEGVAAEKAGNNQILADATSQIAANGEARKDQIEQRYMENKTNLNLQLGALEKEKANAITEAIKGVGSAASNLDV